VADPYLKPTILIWKSTAPVCGRERRREVEIRIGRKKKWGEGRTDFPALVVRDKGLGKK